MGVAIPGWPEGLGFRELSLWKVTNQKAFEKLSTNNAEAAETDNKPVNLDSSQAGSGLGISHVRIRNQYKAPYGARHLPLLAEINPGPVSPRT